MGVMVEVLLRIWYSLLVRFFFLSFLVICLFIHSACFVCLFIYH